MFTKTQEEIWLGKETTSEGTKVTVNYRAKTLHHMKKKANRDLETALAEINFILNNPRAEEKITVEDRKVHKKPPTKNRRTKGLPRGVVKDLRCQIKNCEENLEKVKTEHGENSEEAETAKKFLVGIENLLHHLSNAEIAEMGNLRDVFGAPLKKQLPYPFIYDWLKTVHQTLKNLGFPYNSEWVLDLERNKNGETNIGYYTSLQSWLVSGKSDSECSVGDARSNHVVLWRY